MVRNDLILLGLLWAVSCWAATPAIGQTGRAPRPERAAPGDVAAPFEVALVDGTVLQVASLRAEGAERVTLELAAGGRRVAAWSAVLAVHSVSAAVPALPVVELVGGDRVHGLVVGGDSGGDSLDVQSPVLGRVRIDVDRLACLVLQPELASSADLVLPAGVDEVLFEKARIGFDRLAGALHQFGDGRLRFQVEGAEQPRWFDARDTVGLRIGGGVARPDAAEAELITRVGDRVGVGLRGLAADGLTVELEGERRLEIGWGDVACLTFLQHGAVFASSLEPAEVRERSFDGEVLLPWRRDVSVAGGPLTVTGRTHARGLGVHSQSHISYAAPPGSVGFWTRVAFDDEVLELPVRGQVDLRVEVDGKVAFEARTLRAGDEPLSTGVLAVQPGQTVTLIVDFGAGRDVGDRVDWLSPVFLTAR